MPDILGLVMGEKGGLKPKNEGLFTTQEFGL
jgi:hypothetical protein